MNTGAAMVKLMPIYRMDCDDWYRSAQIKPCIFGDPKASKTVLMLGDSVVMQWFPAVRQLYQRPGWRLVVLTKSSCPMVETDFYYGRIGGIYQKCAAWRSSALQWVDDYKPDVVIMGSSNDYGFSAEGWVSGTRTVLERLSRSAGHVVMLRSTPFLTAGGSNDFEDVHGLELEAGGGIENLTVVDMNPFVCPRAKCSRENYRDARHLAPEFAESLAPSLGNHLFFGGRDSANSMR